MTFLYGLAICALGFGLVVFSYLDRIYREFGRVSSGPIHDHLDIFEKEIEPALRLPRPRAASAFRLLANLWLVVVTAETARGVIVFVPGTWDAIVQALVYVLVEVLLLSQFIPDFLLVRTKGRWVLRFVVVIRAFLWIVWPFRVVLEMAVSLAHMSYESARNADGSQQDGIEALVDHAEQEGILEPDEAHMIEQVIEFSDKRILEFMTPRPNVVAIAANSTVEQLRQLLIQAKFSRVPVYDSSVDDVIGIVLARDLLQVSESDARHRLVKELVRPVLFIPETKIGSDLLKEMQRQSQQMAIVVDEHGAVAGIVTIEDLLEEIIGEIGEYDRVPAPDALPEADGSLILRGSDSLEKVQELFEVQFSAAGGESVTTIAGLLNHVAGHVPAAGETMAYGGLRFDILEANQRRVLRLRARRIASATSPI